MVNAVAVTAAMPTVASFLPAMFRLLSVDGI
jgi:hypothetical protein